MDAFLGKITSHAMNYAIRTAVGVTASYAIKQTSRLLKTVDDSTDHRELQTLQIRLNSKIQIITPAIDMVEIISARGNTTLESAVALTKGLRADIEALGIRLSKAATEEETSRKGSNKTKSRAAHESEIHLIIYDMKTLLARLDSAIPELQLAITTSGASLSTTLPATVSPSRMLQASAFLNSGDWEYAKNPGVPCQIGPAFTLSLYMLFSGHSNRIYEEGGRMRGATMKEVLHKARVKLMRVPLEQHDTDLHDYETALVKSIEDGESAQIRGNTQQTEYSYQIEIIEDLEDDRVHTFEEGDAPPGPYGGVDLAGIREIFPIHQVSRIFYATTGKILGVESGGGANAPVLLLKRDINAQAPRIVMQEKDSINEWDDYEENDSKVEASEDDDDFDIDEQIRRESSVIVPETPDSKSTHEKQKPWTLPPNLDPEWLAVGVYPEDSDDSDSEDDLDPETDPNGDSAYASHRPSSSDADLPSAFSTLNLSPPSSPPAPPKKSVPLPESTSTPTYPNIRSSLSLLEMLIRLTSLQQYQQASHLSIPDELLTFFLEESSAAGAGAEQARKAMRHSALEKLNFDPYNESPVKRHGEDYQYQNGGGEEAQQGQDWDGNGYSGSRGGTPDFRSSIGSGASVGRRSLTPQRGSTPQTQAQPWLSRNGMSPLPLRHGQSPSSPISPYRPQHQQRKATRPVDRVQREGGVKGSPLGRAESVVTESESDPDSTLGSEVLSPTLVEKRGG